MQSFGRASCRASVEPHAELLVELYIELRRASCRASGRASCRASGRASCRASGRAVHRASVELLAELWSSTKGSARVSA